MLMNIQMDYHPLPVPAAATGIWRSFLSTESTSVSTDAQFGEDKAYRIAAATKQDTFDAMLRSMPTGKGNYFSGKRRERYGYIGP